MSKARSFTLTLLSVLPTKQGTCSLLTTIVVYRLVAVILKRLH
jgi:hypothetical protein